MTAATRGRQLGFSESWGHKITRQGPTTRMLVNPTGTVKNSGGLTTAAHISVSRARPKDREIIDRQRWPIHPGEAQDGGL